MSAATPTAQPGPSEPPASEDQIVASESGPVGTGGAEVEPEVEAPTTAAHTTLLPPGYRLVTVRLHGREGDPAVEDLPVEVRRTAVWGVEFSVGALQAAQTLATPAPSDDPAAAKAHASRSIHHNPDAGAAMP